MPLNKIIFFLLLVMPQGQIKGTEHLPDNVQCTQIMTSGSPSLCQNWVLGHWEICSNSCLSKSGSVFLCSGLSHVSAFHTAISALHTYWFQRSSIPSEISVARKSKCQGMVWLGQKSIVPWSSQVSIRAGTIIQVEHTFNQWFNHLFGILCLICVFQAGAQEFIKY